LGDASVKALVTLADCLGGLDAFSAVEESSVKTPVGLQVGFKIGSPVAMTKKASVKPFLFTKFTKTECDRGVHELGDGRGGGRDYPSRKTTGMNIHNRKDLAECKDCRW